MPLSRRQPRENWMHDVLWQCCSLKLRLGEEPGWISCVLVPMLYSSPKPVRMGSCVNACCITTCPTGCSMLCDVIVTHHMDLCPSQSLPISVSAHLSLCPNETALIAPKLLHKHGRQPYVLTGAKSTPVRGQGHLGWHCAQPHASGPQRRRHKISYSSRMSLEEVSFKRRFGVPRRK